MRYTRNGCSCSFTLTELVVLIAILGVLAAVLVPALTAATEEARRKACQNNLQEFASALSTYLSDYHQYYPSMHAYATPATGTPPDIDLGLFSAVSLSGQKQTIPSMMVAKHDAGWHPNYLNAYSTANWYFRCIAIATKMPPLYWMPGYTGEEPHPTAADYDKGNVNLAPNGLGILAPMGYVPDLKTYFCPSVGENEFPAPYCPRVFSGWRPIQKLGSTEGRALIYGDLSWCNLWKGTADPPGDYFYGYGEGMVFTSHYNYRNAPTYHDGAGAQTWSVFWTQPLVSYDLKGPMFKTSKLLGGRAIISDTFDRKLAADNPEVFAKPEAGYVQYHHREGYNVLYGDGHATWHADPEQKITYHPCDDKDNWSQTLFMAGVTTSMDEMARSHMRVWHQFDVAAGLDADAPVSAQ